MNRLRLTVLLGLTAGLAAAVRAEEINGWPVRVAHTDASGTVTSWQGAGPFVFAKTAAAGGSVAGVRPFFVRTADEHDRTREVAVLYPLYLYRSDPETYSWSVFQLINRSGPRAGSVAAPDENLGREAFDVWPFWFSRRTGSPDTSYRALFPVAGEVKYRFGYDRLNWTLFPLFAQAHKAGTITTATPWPFVRVTRGQETGFALWPLFGWRERPGTFTQRYWLWPFFYRNLRQPDPDAPAGTPPTRQIGALPFYAGTFAPGLTDRTYVWPFFGYTDRTIPYRYSEQRYFWPLLVQGHGDDRRINRWAPVYTHSVIKGMDKTWVLWPLYRDARWTDGPLAQRKTQFLYFLYWSQQQRSLAHPAAAPAEKTHLWPLVSAWDNGAGRTQLQIPSPLEVFFPNNTQVRQSWTPLFALYRFDRSAATATTRHELLWGAVSWHRQSAQREFHLGPLLGVTTSPSEQKISFGRGLLGVRRPPGTKTWHLFWFEFPAKAHPASPPASR